MGKSIKATLDVQGWKQHTCLACDSKFRYLMKRRAESEAKTEDEARAQVGAVAVAKLRDEIDKHPCPHCGYLQPEMVSNSQSNLFWGALGIGVVGVGAALVLGLTDVITIGASAMGAAVATAIAGATVTFASVRNPNSDLNGNRMRAMQAAQAGLLLLDAPGSTSSQPDRDLPKPLGTRSLVAMGLFAVAILIAFAPILLKSANSWPTNENWYPEVVGPGDTSTFYMLQTIRSVNSKWVGGAEVTIANREELGLPPSIAFTGESSRDHWGNTISGKNVSNKTNRMWVKIKAPGDPSLAGKTFDLDVSVNAAFPLAEGNTFTNESQQFNESTRLQLASPGAGKTYKQAWWIGQLAVIGLTIAACTLVLTLAGNFAKRGNPHEIVEVNPAQG